MGASPFVVKVKHVRSRTQVYQPPVYRISRNHINRVYWLLCCVESGRISMPKSCGCSPMIAAAISAGV